MGGSEDRGLDISDEALEARGWEPDTAQADDTPVHEEADGGELEAADAPVDREGDTPDTTEEGGGDEGDAQVVDEPVSGEAAGGSEGGEPEWQMPDKFAGKSAEEIARLAVESESYFGRKLEELRQQQEAAAQQQQAELAAYMAAQQAASFDADAALNGLDPVPAYNTAIQMLDQGLADPSIVNRVISETRDLDPDLASEMARDFDRRIMRAEYSQQLQQLQQQFEQQVAPIQQQTFVQAAQQASAEFMSAEPDAAAYQQDIAKIVSENPNLLGDRSPAAIKAGLNAALVQARGADITRSTAYQQQLAAEKAAAQVEQGGAPKQAPMSEVDRIRAEVFGAKDPADALFS